jgi:hypothetical protein
LAVPLLLVSVWTTRRGSGFALVTWAGALLYVVYNAVLFLFLTPFNTAFLVYVALLGSALWSVGYLAATRELWRVGRVIASRAPVRGVATYVWVIAALNAAAWLAMVTPSLVPYPTPMLQGTGVQTNAIYIEDLAVWLPLAAVAALWLRRRETRGAVVVGAVVGLWVIESVSIAVDQWFGGHADPSSSVASLTMVVANTPPGRASIVILSSGVDMPGGPQKWVSCSGSKKAEKSISRGKSKSRVMVTSPRSSSLPVVVMVAELSVMRESPCACVGWS